MAREGGPLTLFHPLDLPATIRKPQYDCRVRPVTGLALQGDHMRTIVRLSALLLVAVLWAATAHAQTAAQAKPAATVQAQASTQTADDVIEKHLAALGGRAALAKLESRTSTGSISVSTQGMELPGSVEINVKAPNKSRSFIKLDLSAVGGAEMVIDQRFDGKSGYTINSMQGDREITGNQLENMQNGGFPTPLMKYKEAGTKVELTGRDKVGTREALVIKYTPKAGSASRQYSDAETYLLLRSVTTVDVPEAGGPIEQTSDLSDYREVDGVKLPFTVQNVSSIQTVTIRLNKVEHNKPIDDALFAKPVVK